MNEVVSLYPERQMELHQFDSEQVKRAANLLQACGIEPTTETMQALAETAIAHYPNEPESLEKAARSMVEFFEGSPTVAKASEHPWMRLRLWAFSMLRF